MNRPSDPKTTADSTTKNIVNGLAYGGVFPFLILAVAACLESKYSSLLQYALVAYGAVILSFVGALHWGFAMSQQNMSQQVKQRSFVWSVAPALLAWMALLMEPNAASLLIIFGFALHFLQDWRLAKLLSLPTWYLPLRLRLTVIASLSLSSIHICR